MLKKLTLFILVSVLFTSLNAQLNSNKWNAQNGIIPSKNTPVKFTPQKSELGNKSFSTNCIDTILYPQSKTTGLEIDTMSFGYVEGISEAYYLSTSGFVHGVKVYILLDTNGIPGDATPITMIMKVSNVDNLNRPTTKIDSIIVTINDVGNQEQTLLFSSPVPVSTDFSVSLELNPATPNVYPFYVTNNSTANDGKNEQLATALYAGVWYNFQAQFPPWDMDMLIAPIFEKNLSTSFTVDTNSVCLGNSVKFTNTTAANVDSMFYTSPDTYSLDLDGGTTIVSLDTNYTYTYPSSAVYNPQFTVTQNGYTSNCVDVTSLVVTVLDTAIANFSFAAMGGGLYQFTDLSTSATGIKSWSWDFGDGSPLDTNQSPTHTYSTSNNYNVCLTVSDSNGCNINTFCQVVPFTVGINNYETVKELNIYPIPASKFFTVSVPNDYFGGRIIISDVVGQEVKSILIEDNPKIKILTDEIPSGVYFVSVEYHSEKMVTKRIVIDK